MSAPLRPELLPPTHRHFTYLIGAATGVGIAAVIGAIVTTTSPVLQELPIAPPALEKPSPQLESGVVAAEPPPSSSELSFVFRAGDATYVKLADVLADREGRKLLPPHGKPQLVEDETGFAAVAGVAPRDVPALHRGITGERIRVGGGCVAEVVGFAVVSRLIGDPDYAGEHTGAWTADAVMKAGSPVLAARLSGCEGRYARRAALPPIVELEPRADAALVDAARSALLASDAARETQAAWTEAEGDGSWFEHADVDTRVLRHPITGVTWVSVHGSYSEGCGGPEANVWGLFRVDREGALETVEARVLEELHAIEDIIDLEGDGELELVGRDWLGNERLLIRANGAELDRLRQHFYGCPC